VFIDVVTITDLALSLHILVYSNVIVDSI